jgi:hypothetical protein
MRRAPPLATLSPVQHARLKHAMKKLVLASVEFANRGGGHPEDVPFIEADLRSARSSFWALFSRSKE